MWGAQPRLRARQVGARPGLSGASSPARRTRGGGGQSREGTDAEGTGGGPGGHSPPIQGPSVRMSPPKPLGPLLPLLFCRRRRRRRVPLPPPPPKPEPEPEPEPEPPPLPPPPPLPSLPRQLQPRAPARARARARAPAPAVRVPGTAPPLVHSHSPSGGAA